MAVFEDRVHDSRLAHGLGLADSGPPGFGLREARQGVELHRISSTAVARLMPPCCSTRSRIRTGSERLTSSGSCVIARASLLSPTTMRLPGRTGKARGTGRTPSPGPKAGL